MEKEAVIRENSFMLLLRSKVNRFRQKKKHNLVNSYCEDEVKEDEVREDKVKEDEVKKDPTPESLLIKDISNAWGYFLAVTLQKEGFFTLTPLDKAVWPRAWGRAWGSMLALYTMILCWAFLLEGVKNNPESLAVAKAVLAPLEKYLPKDVSTTLKLALIGAEQATKLEKNDPQMVTYENLVGLDDAKEDLRWIMRKHQGDTQHPHVPLVHGTLIYGRNGTGKTTLVHATARECNVSFFQVEAVNLGKSGFSGVNLTSLFTEAKACSPSIILIENIDEITSKSSELLSEMTKCASAKSKVLVLATTTNPGKVDIQLLTSPMFHDQVKIGNLKVNERKKIIGLHLQKFLLKEDEASICMYIANETPAIVPSELISIAIDSVKFAAKRGSNLVAMEDAEKAVEASKLKFRRKESL